MHYARIPYTMRNNNIRLKRLRFSDIPFLGEWLKHQEISISQKFHKIKFLSWLHVWWWITKTFALIYCIECDSLRIGFIGLYNLKLGKSAEMTLVIFKIENRRRGYGSSAFGLLAQYLKDHHIINKIIVRTEIGNVISLTFWQKLGFRKVHISHDIATMHIDFNYYSLNLIDTLLQ
jgi:RimJ/RimL family protein N-acetyltransferase